MAITTITNGNIQDEQFVANSQDTWADLGSSPFGTWATWTAWNTNPDSMTIVIFEDTQISSTKLPLLEFRAEGAVTVELKTSDSIDSNLILQSPDTITFVENTEVTPPTAQYYQWTITVAPDSNTVLPLISSPVLGFIDARDTVFIEGIDTSTLSGTIDAREIETDIATVTALIATAREGGVTYSPTTYPDRQYAVPDDFVFDIAAIIVNTVSLAPPKIRCFDLNNESIDAVVDIYLEGLGSIVLTTEGVVAT